MAQNYWNIQKLPTTSPTVQNLAEIYRIIPLKRREYSIVRVKPELLEPKFIPRDPSIIPCRRAV